MRILSRLPLAIATATLVACGSSLIWQATYSTPEPKIVSALAVDSHNNSYVGGGRRVGYEYRFMQFFEGLLLKYDANGALIWKSDVPLSSMVIDVAVLNEETLVVATGARLEGGSSEFLLGDLEPGASELWLVSAATGEFQRQLLAFEQSGDESQYREMIVSDGVLYVAQKQGVDPSTLFAFDQSGNLLRQWSPDSGEIVDIELAGDDLYVTTTSSHRFHKFNRMFEPQWSLDQGTLPECEAFQVAARGQHAYAICGDSFTKLDVDGNVQFTRDFSFLLNAAEGSQDTFVNPGIAKVDVSGNLYFANTRSTVLYTETGPVRIGNLWIHHASTLKSDAVIAKLDGATGEVLWNDDINGALFPAGNRFTSSYYFPLAINLVDDKALLTIRGVVSNYVGMGNGQNCLIADTEEWFPLNTCERESIVEQYAKTFEYAMADGKRLKDIKHNVTFPRRVTLDADQHLLIAGDQEYGALAYPEIFSLGQNEMGEEFPLSTSSDIILQKYK